jgi:hypothetical protein
MRFYDNALLRAASDLNAFLVCAHAAALNLQRLRDPQSLPDKADDDESMVLSRMRAMRMRLHISPALRHQETLLKSTRRVIWERERARPPKLCMVVQATLHAEIAPMRQPHLPL